jgi:hypothetical protein
MAVIDSAMAKFDGFPGYKGNPPTTVSEYNEVFGVDNPWDNKPSWEELQKASYEIEYKLNRSKEYPPITDYIDGVVKGDKEQIQAYIDACLAVKAKYPKGA